MSEPTCLKYALETKAVVKTYQTDSGTISAVDECLLAGEAGEFVALVGPSGSGKTTMLSMLAALLQPSSGQILLDGQDLAGMNDARTGVHAPGKDRLYLPGQQPGALPERGGERGIDAAPEQQAG